MGHLEKQCYLKSKQQGFRNVTVQKRPPEVRNIQELEAKQGPLESYELTPEEQEEIDYYEESADFQQSAYDCAPYTENTLMDVPTDF